MPCGLRSRLSVRHNDVSTGSSPANIRCLGLSDMDITEESFRTFHSIFGDNSVTDRRVQLEEGKCSKRWVVSWHFPGSQSSGVLPFLFSEVELERIKVIVSHLVTEADVSYTEVE